MRRAIAILVIAALTAGLLSSVSASAPPDLASYVNPFIGTLGAGFVFPGPAAPFGMVQVSPDTEGQFAYTGYQYADRSIRGFSHVHIESMGVQEGGNVPFMPTVGAVSTDVKKYESRFNHASEKASPGYYKVRLDSYGIDAELTAGKRIAMQRYEFPSTTQANVLIDAGRQIPGGPTDDVETTPGAYQATVSIVDATTVMGTANPSLDGPQRYAVHFATKFSRPFTSYGVWDAKGAAPKPMVASVSGKGAGAYLTFDTTSDRSVTAKVGISFVSQQNALQNLEAEAPGSNFDFDSLRANTRADWNAALGAIEVQGSELDDTSFYTALYHAQHHPNLFNDANGQYLGHDGAVHQIGALGDAMPVGSAYYANFSLWDTYRAEMPLLAMIQPSRYTDMMRSLNAIKIQGGRLPRWSLNNRYPDYMNGEPSLQVIADGFCRGLIPTDLAQSLYGGARNLALVNNRDPSYLTKGYVPADVDGPGKLGSGASSTLEHASGDFALALMADKLGLTADRDTLLGMANNYHNVFDGQTRFMRPRNADGSWVGTPYLPERPEGWREGTGWQYTWLASHDVRGLFTAMGASPKNGDNFVSSQLDTFFSEPLSEQSPLGVAEAQQKATLFGIAYYGNQYAPSNEHDLQAPWLYNWLHMPWKTQALQRSFQGLYRPTPDGLPGNDDLGTMSAWFVWSALGFYPVIPGSPTYTIGSPMFTSAIIHTGASTSFVVQAPTTSLRDKYVANVTLNGQPLTKTWFDHPVLTAGGTLSFEMSPAPMTWGSSAGAEPPSMSTNPLTDFSCRNA